MDTSKQMPDLGAATQSDGDQRRRILAQLEHGPRVANVSATAATSASNMRRWSVDGWTVGLVLLLLFMGATTWLLQDEAHAPPRWKNQSARSDAKPVPVSATAASSPRTTLTTPSESTRHAAQPAVIISDPAPAQAAAAPVPDPVTPVSATAKATYTKPPSNTASSSRAPSTASATAPKPSKTPQKSTSSADTDVALLSALVAHAGTPAKVSPARSRDVVEAHDDEATASLLARCQQLGPIEGMLCRSRICADRWDSDPACRVPASGVR